jgi:hypothetical protein
MIIWVAMTIDYSEDGKVRFSMPDYIKGLLDEGPEDTWQEPQ